MTGNELKEVRKSLGFTQSKFACMLGLTQVWVSHLERENRELSSLTEKKVKFFEKKLKKRLDFIKNIKYND